MSKPESTGGDPKMLTPIFVFFQVLISLHSAFSYLFFRVIVISKSVKVFSCSRGKNGVGCTSQPESKPVRLFFMAA